MRSRTLFLSINYLPRHLFLRLLAALSGGILMMAGWLAGQAPNQYWQDLAARAEQISVATCTGSQTFSNGPRGLPFTVYTFRREAGVAGTPAGDSFSLRILGGVTGRFRVTVPDAPQFQTGASYLLLLRRSASRQHLLVAGGQHGVLEARRDGDGGSWRIHVRQWQLPPAGAAGRPPQAGGWISLKDLQQVLSIHPGGN